MNTPVAGRLLFLSVSAKGGILAFVTTPGSALADEFHAVSSEQEGVFKTFTIAGQDSRKVLLAELARIHTLDWITAKQLKTDGRILPRNAPNCGKPN